MRRISLYLMLFLLFTVMVPAFAVPTTAAVSKPIHLTIVLKEQSLPKTFKDFLTNLGCQIVREIPQLGVVQVNGAPDLITTLQKNTLVKAVGPSIKMKLPNVKTVPFNPQDNTHVTQQINQLPNQANSPLDHSTSTTPSSIVVGEEELYPDYYESLQWDIKRVTNYGSSFKYNSGSHDVIVGIIDTGVDYNHPDLIPNYLGGKNYVPEDLNKGETGNPEDVMDRNGHGSYVAGAIAGKGQILGVAPNVGYKAYRVFGATGGAETSTIAQAIIGATDEGVDVISMSLGGYSVIGQIFWNDPSTGKRYNLGNDVADFLLYKRAVKYATDHGITVVAAAGNDNINITSKGKVTDFLNQEYGGDGYYFVGAGFEQPGLDPGVITVSATGPMDTRASYSNFGPGSIDVTAPGGDFQRYEKGFWYLDLCFGAYKNSDYIYMAGTSMATPKVSAVAALLINKYGKIGPQKIAQMIRDNAEDIGEQGKDQYFGNGMVQAPYEKEQLPAEVDWHKQFGGALMERASKVHQISDGGYITVGSSQTFSSKGTYWDDITNWWKTDIDLLVVKTGKDGRTEWYRPLGSDSSKEWGNDVIQTKDGGYLVLGYSGKNDTGDSTDVYLVKLSSSGETQWEKTIGVKDVSETGVSVLQSPDGGFIITGTAGNAGLANYDILLLKTDGNGNKLWEKRYGGTANDTPSSIKATSDGGYIIAGQTYSVDFGRKSDFYLVKVDSKGNLLWENKFGKGNLIEDFLYDVVETPSGDYMVAGESQQRQWLGGGLPKIVSQSYIANITKLGKLNWEKYYGDANSSQAVQGLTKSQDGSYMAAGWIETLDNSYEAALMKFDNKGNQLWVKQYGGTYEDFGMSIEATKDGGYAILGFTHSYTSGTDFDSDMYLLKLNRSANN